MLVLSPSRLLFPLPASAAQTNFYDIYYLKYEAKSAVVCAERLRRGGSFAPLRAFPMYLHIVPRRSASVHFPFLFALYCLRGYSE